MTSLEIRDLQQHVAERLAADEWPAEVMMSIVTEMVQQVRSEADIIDAQRVAAAMILWELG